MMEKLKNNYYKSFWFHLLVNSLFFLLISYLLPIGFDTNDDATLLLISSGAYSGIPDAHLVYMNYIYGLLLKGLYTFYDGVEWYTLCLVVIHVLSLSIVTWCVVRANVLKIWKILGIALLYLLEIQIVLRFQYTTTASLCSMAAVILFLAGNTYQRYLAALLFTLATFIRFDPAYLALLIFLPTIFFFFIKQRDKIKILLPLSLFLILSVGGKFIDKTIYDSDKEWKEYSEFNFYRGKVSDNPNSFKLKELPETVSEADFFLFREFFPDTKVMTNEKAESIYQWIKNASLTEKLKNIYNKDSGPRDNLARYTGILSAFLIFGIYLFLVHDDKQKKYLAITSTLVFILSLTYVTLEGILWHRVLMSAVIPFAMVLVYVCSSLTRGRFAYITAFLLLGMVVFLGGDDINKRKNAIKSHAYGMKVTEESLFSAKSFLKEGEYIINYASALRLEAFPPFSLSERYRDNRFIILSWLSKVPFNKGIIDSYEDIVDKNVICMDALNRKEHLSYLKQSILENYGIVVQENILAEVSGNIVFRLETVKE